MKGISGTGKPILGTGSLSLLLLLMIAASFTIGAFPAAPTDVARLLVAKLLGTAHGLPEPLETVILQVRLPRLAAAVLVGAALSAAGAAYQGLFRNPLVSPDILGVSSGAVLGIYLSLPVIGIQALAFLFGLATVSLVYIVAIAVRGHEPVLVLVLTGVVVGALAGATISLLKVLADPYDQLPAITFWLLGSLAAVNSDDLPPSCRRSFWGLLPLYLLRWRMNLMSLGDEEAQTLGLNVRVLRIIFICAATLMTTAVVSISGVVGWVGLIMPHIARLLVGPNFMRLLPTAMLLGAGYLLLVDDLARTLAMTEVPLGILTAFLGAPFFL